MTDKLSKYKSKRNFNITGEPKESKIKKSKTLRFVVQHHIASRDHYDFRLEWEGVLKSWAIPKGLSYNPEDKRLAVLVEDHPLDYRNFEGVIPEGEYGAGPVMVWDEGIWIPYNNPSEGLKKGYLKFTLKGKRLKGDWSLVRMKENNWLLVKENDEYSKDESYIEKYKTSIKTGFTIEEIKKGKKKTKNIKNQEENIIESINITNPDKILFNNLKLSKEDLILYYKKVYFRMEPFLKNRLISTIRCPDGIEGTCFFKKHLGLHNKGLGMVNIPDDDGDKEDYYYIKNIKGFISEVQMNTIEFHIWGSTIKDLDKPDMIVFDLDPDEGMKLEKIRQGVRDLKGILDKLSLTSFLKTSGGKGYHVVIPINPSVTWNKLREFSKNIAEFMEKKWPDKYVSNVRKDKRKNKIFIDWIRNLKGATNVAPYSVRIKDNASVSMPIKWSELDKVTPNDITISEAIKRLRRKDPWEKFFEVKQQLK